MALMYGLRTFTVKLNVHYVGRDSRHTWMVARRTPTSRATSDAVAPASTASRAAYRSRSLAASTSSRAARSATTARRTSTRAARRPSSSLTIMVSSLMPPPAGERPPAMVAAIRPPGAGLRRARPGRGGGRSGQSARRRMAGADHDIPLEDAGDQGEGDEVGPQPVSGHVRQARVRQEPGQPAPLVPLGPGAAGTRMHQQQPGGPQQTSRGPGQRNRPPPTPRRPAGTCPAGVNPARAGMIPPSRCSRAWLWRKPRASGDDPHIASITRQQ